METGGRLETTHPWGQLKVPALLPCSLTFPPAGFPSNIHPIAPSLPPFRSPCFCLLPIKYCFPSQPSPLPWSLARSQPLGLQALGPLHSAASPCAWPLLSPLCTHPRRGAGDAPFPHRPHHCHHQRCWPLQTSGSAFPPPLCGPLRVEATSSCFSPRLALESLLLLLFHMAQSSDSDDGNGLFTVLLTTSPRLPFLPPPEPQHPSIMQGPESLSKADPAFTPC